MSKTISLETQMDMVQNALNRATARMPSAVAVEVYSDYAIIDMDGAHYKVGYSVNVPDPDADRQIFDDVIQFAPFDDWQKVGRAWSPTKTYTLSPTKNTQVSIKAITEDSVTVAGYGVVFGGRDLEGETFSASTDYMLDLVPDKLVMYDHAQNENIRHVIGNAAKIAKDEFGLFVEAELDRHAEYVEQIRELVEVGALGWSSGSVAHLTQREGKHIKRWPLVEFSLTPSPAEPRTLGVETIKHLAETDEAFGALLPEGDRTSPEQGANTENVDGKRLTIELDILEMEGTR